MKRHAELISASMMIYILNAEECSMNTYCFLNREIKLDVSQRLPPLS